jgi:hypothetical protein
LRDACVALPRSHITNRMCEYVCVYMFGVLLFRGILVVGLTMILPYPCYRYSILPSVVTPPLDRGPMEQFCFSKHERKVRAAITILLDSGASPNADSKQGSANPSVLLMAIRANDLSMAVNLIERGANVDFYGVDGMTLLHVALSQVKHYSNVLHMINVWRRRSKLQPAFFKVVDPHKERFQ